MTDAAPNRPLRVFLCHASNDKPAVRDLHRRLTADGFAPWLDEEDLLPGQRWQIEIPKAVRDSDVVLVCLSQHSLGKAGYVQKEIKFALDAADEQPDGTIFLIPLRLEACEVPERLSQVQWVNFYDEGGYARLLRALRKRSADLNATTTAVNTRSSSPAATETRDPAVSNVSGGINVDADNVTVGHDVVGRDKVIQANTYIEHATIIQAGAPMPAGAPIQDIKQTAPAATDNRRVIGGLEFVRVPAGKFIMGSKDDNQLAYDDEKPQHTVEIPYDYWLARYEVTNDQFAAFIEATQYVTTAEKEGGGSSTKRQYIKGVDWRHPLDPKSGLKNKGDHPVVQVSGWDALAYCQWLNTLAKAGLPAQGLTLRLPTEAEWEKAARGGFSPVANGGGREGAREWPWGNDFDQNKCNSIVGGKSDTTPVGRYSPQGDSPYGTADMAGNVWEWTISLWGSNFNKPQYGYPYQPTDGREKLDAPDDVYRVVRGGSFRHDARRSRSAFRFRLARSNHNVNVGLRVVVAHDTLFLPEILRGYGCVDEAF